MNTNIESDGILEASRKWAVLLQEWKDAAEDDPNRGVLYAKRWVEGHKVIGTQATSAHGIKTQLELVEEEFAGGLPMVEIDRDTFNNILAGVTYLATNEGAA